MVISHSSFREIDDRATHFVEALMELFTWCPLHGQGLPEVPSP